MPIDRDARISPGVFIPESSFVWGGTLVREGAIVGEHVVLGRNVYVGPAVRIGNGCRIQNGAQVFEPAEIGEGVFIGPNAVLTNDRRPRALQTDGRFTVSDDWDQERVRIERGASLGAGVIVVGPVLVGAWAMVGAAAVVTKSVLPHSMMVGNPARRVAWVGRSGRQLVRTEVPDVWMCPATHETYNLTD